MSGISLGGDSSDDTDAPDMPGKFDTSTSGTGLTKDIGNLKLHPSSPTDVDLPKPLGIIVTGEKDTGKTVGPAGIPRPYGGKTYILTFDDATMAGLRNYYTPEELEDVIVIELTKKQYNDDGEVVYPGYDPNQPKTAETVCGTAMGWLEQIDEAGDCDNLILDHFQYLRNDIAQSYTISHHNLDPLGNLKPQHYNLRTRAVKMIESKARHIPRHTITITGYGEEEKLQSRKKPDGSTDWYVGLKKPKWVDRYKKPYHVHVNHSSSAKVHSDDPYDEATDEIDYFYHVVSSKHELFPKGHRFKATGGNYSMFWDKEKQAERLMDEMDVELEDRDV